MPGRLRGGGRRPKGLQPARRVDAIAMHWRRQIVPLESIALVRGQSTGEVVVDDVVLGRPHAIEELLAREIIPLERGGGLIVELASR